MKKTFLFKNIPLLLLGSGLLLSVAFAQTTGNRQKAAVTDTLPTKHGKVRNLDEALAEIDRSEVEMQKALKEIDQDRIEKEIRQAMKDMDTKMAKMKEELAAAMNNLDRQKIDLDVQKALKEVKSEAIKQEMKAALAKAELENTKAELEKMKEMNRTKIKDELGNLRPQVEKALEEAKKNMKKARQEITNYKNLVDALDKDGLLNKNVNYKIEFRNNQLTVNGKTLSAEESQKYRSFLNGKGNFTLQKDEDGLDINKK